MARRAVVNSRKQPGQSRSKMTVEAILIATSRILVQDGYEATSTTRVAKLAGVSVGSLYQYFPTKEALVAALVDDHIEKILAILTEATATLQEVSLEVGVRTMVRNVLLAHTVNPELHAVLTQSFAHVEGFEKVRALTTTSQEIVKSYLELHKERLRVKSSERAAFIIVHSVQAVVSAAVVDRRFGLDDEELIDDLVELVLRFLT